MSDARQDVADRYAGAFFELSQEEGVTPKVEDDMRAIRAALTESVDLQRLVVSPVFEPSDKAKALDAILAKQGAQPLTRNLIGLMARNGRVFALDGVAKAFLARAAKQRGEVAAEAVSAHPLTDEQTKALRAQIEGSVGKSVNLETRVDPSLLGGLIVKVGSRMMDSSLKTKLGRLQARLTEA